MRPFVACTVLLGALACKGPFALYCETQADCASQADTPFCDVNGDVSGLGNHCIADPIGGLSPPRLLSPMNGKFTGTFRSTLALRPPLRWHAVPQATSYEVQLDDSCQATDFGSCVFPSPEISQVGITAITWRPDTPLPVLQTPPVGRRYFWRVRACNSDRCSGWSAVRYLDVGRLNTDYNGDGFGDVLVGGGRQDVNAQGVSTAFLYLGKASWPSDVNVADVAIHGPGLMLDSFGARVHPAGDVNGDGYADMLIAEVDDVVEGEVLLYFGRGTWPASVASPDVTFRNPGATAGFGSILASGDLNGDGRSDIVVANPLQANPEQYEGGILIFLGRESWPAIISTFDVLIDNPLDAELAGLGFMSASGDVNGDGLADIVAGAPGSVGGKGTVFMFSWSAAWDSPAAIIESATVTMSAPIAANPGFGVAVEIGDMNGDGFDDITVLAPNETTPQFVEGSVFLYLGRDDWGAFIDTADSRLSVSAESILLRMEPPLSTCDVNGDELIDLVIGSANGGDPSGEGAAFLFLGREQWPTTGVASDTTFENTFNQMNSWMSSGGSCKNDIDGDGLSDVLLGTPSLSNPEVGEGSVFVWLGRASWPPLSGIANVLIDNPEDRQADFGVAVR